MNQSWQDYLVAIFSIGEFGEDVTNKSISDRLMVSPPSVTDMLKKLKAENFLEVKKGVVKLTEYGEEKAKDILSKHRLWEYFLENNMGYDWGDVHEESKSLQYATSDKLMYKLNEMLNYPKRCPHGGIIYLNYKEDISPIVNIKELKTGDRVKIERFSDERFLLDYADRRGIRLGDILKLSYIDNFDESMVFIDEDGSEVLLSSKAVNSIFMSKID